MFRFETVDNHTPEQRHKNMAAIKCKDTEIEVRLRKELWSRGLRYRKNCRDVPGKPDIVFKGAKVAVFCDSEFWHGKDWEKRKDEIQSNRNYWIPKIERNIERDKEVNSLLEENGWKVIRFWGEDIDKHTSECADKVEAAVRGMRN
nr:very short patch repair endonuclease [Candidatus Methanomethylophilus sp. 1R26]